MKLMDIANKGELHKDLGAVMSGSTECHYVWHLAERLPGEEDLLKH